MSEALLGIVAIALIAHDAWSSYQSYQERKTLIHALKAKDAHELKQLEQEVVMPGTPDPDLIPEGEADDELWREAIKKEQEPEEDEE